MTCRLTESSAPPVPPGAFEQQLQHLIRMAREPGWKAYAWQRAQELDADSSGLFTGIADALRAAMTGPDAPSASAPPRPERRH